MADRIDIVTAVDDDELMMREMPGSGHRLVLAFGGIRQGIAGIPRDEFIATASDKGSNHVLFITDQKCSWFSRAGLTDRIVEHVSQYAQKHQITEIVAIGNSMGGYGAILFSALLPVKRVAAFVPQISMHSEVLDEPRWQEFRPDFGPELARSLEESFRKSTAEIHVVYGAEDRLDQAHAALIPSLPNLHVRMMRHCDHSDAVVRLKDTGYLAKLVNAVLSGTANEVSDLFDAYDRGHRRPTWRQRRRMIRRMIDRVLGRSVAKAG